MASEPDGYERLRNPIADMIYELNVEPDDAVAMADKILALIAERTKEATPTMRKFAWTIHKGGLTDWDAMHAVSPLYPSGTDEIEEKAK